MTDVCLLYLTVNYMRAGNVSALLTAYLLHLMESWIINRGGLWLTDTRVSLNSAHT